MDKRQKTSVHRSVVARVGGATATATFVIKDFATEMGNCRNREILECRPFRLLDHTFAIGVYPRGDAEEHHDMVGVFLRNKGQEPVKVDSFQIIMAGLTKKTDAATIQGTKGWGWPKAISQDACRGYVAARGGDLEVVVEVEMVGRRVAIVGAVEEEVGAQSSCWILDNLYRYSMASADFVLVCEAGEEVEVHRLVLVGASPYFKAMLAPGRPEAAAGRAVVECGARTARHLVRLLYTNKLGGPYFHANLAEFLMIADMYLIDELKRRTERKMAQLLNQGNMVEFMVAGERFNGVEIKREAKAFIQYNLVWLKQQEGWKERFGEEKDLLVEVLE